MNLRSVDSEGAGNATNGRWNANWRGDPLEVPPDGATPSTMASCFMWVGLA